MNRRGFFGVVTACLAGLVVPNQLNQDRAKRKALARKIVAWAKSGAGFALPSRKSDGEKWNIEWPVSYLVRPGQAIDAAQYHAGYKGPNR